MKNLTPFILLILTSSILFFSACGNQQTASNSTSKTTNETVSNAGSNSNTGNSTSTISNKSNLNVSAEFWKKQMDLAKAQRDKPTGESVAGLNVPIELGGGVTKQVQKMNEMVTAGFTLPLDFIDLAEKRTKGELVELPIATENYVLESGGNADDSEFSSFSFENGSVTLKEGTPKFTILKTIADNFDGQKYDLSKPEDRKQIKMRLLRLLNPQAQTTLAEISDSYQKQFSRPLRITALVRSMDYQIALNKTNATTFKVTGKDARPPHLSGLAFDIARNILTAEEQNFIMQKLAEMELNGKIDALMESGGSAVFHVFVYQDGKPPKA